LLQVGTRVHHLYVDFGSLVLQHLTSFDFFQNLALFSVLAIAPSLGSSFQLELRLIIQKILQTFPSDCASASTVPAITPDSAIVLAKSISALLKIGLTEIDGTHVAHWVKSILTPLDGKQGPIWVKYPILADDVATLCVSRCVIHLQDV
jgi:hypothetical protein